MMKAKKLAGHDFVVLALEATDDVFGKTTFRLCTRCGVMMTSFRPRWGATPVYLVPVDLEVLRSLGRWGQHQQPSCLLVEPAASRMAS